MTKKEANKNAMYKKVIGVGEQFMPITEKITALKDSFTEFGVIYSSIQKTDTQYMESTGGKTSSKEDKQDKLIKSIINVTSGTYVYSRKIKDAELMAKMRLTESDIRQMKDIDITKFAKSISETVASLLPELDTYGITQEDIDELNTNTDIYDKSLSNQGTGFTDRSALRLELTRLFNKADELLNEELDFLMNKLEDKEPAFFNAYSSARVIKDFVYPVKNVEEKQTQKA